jgi:hypothetical protein
MSLICCLISVSSLRIVPKPFQTAQLENPLPGRLALLQRCTGQFTGPSSRASPPDVKFAQGDFALPMFIHANQEASKRFVKIEPVLEAWLKPYWGQTQGWIVSQDPWGRRKALVVDRARAGITDWPPNALRHSYASYHLAHFSDASRLALEMGHTSPHLIFRFYRGVVLPEHAVRYWNLYPAAAAAAVKVVF